MTTDKNVTGKAAAAKDAAELGGGGAVTLAGDGDDGVVFEPGAGGVAPEEGAGGVAEGDGEGPEAAGVGVAGGEGVGAGGGVDAAAVTLMANF